MFCISILVTVIGFSFPDHDCVGSYETMRACGHDALRMARAVEVGDNERIGFRCQRRPVARNG